MSDELKQILDEVEGNALIVSQVRGPSSPAERQMADEHIPALHKIAKMYVKELMFHGRKKKLAELTAILNQGRAKKEDLGERGGNS